MNKTGVFCYLKALILKSYLRIEVTENLSSAMFLDLNIFYKLLLKNLNFFCIFQGLSMGLFFNSKKWLFLYLTFLTSTTYAQDLSVKIYGYPQFESKATSVDNLNPLQPENLSLTVPGLVMPKLGSLGQKTSLRFNNYTAGDLVFLLDGFEVSDPTEPAEGFDISSFLMTPKLDFKVSNEDSIGLFSRQAGGIISVETTDDESSYIHSAFGSFGQGLLTVQKIICDSKECFNFGLGGTFADGQSASSNSNGNSGGLESDNAHVGYFSFTWRKQTKANEMIKLRFHSRLSQTDIDDYDNEFLIRDDPNAKLKNNNYFLGISYLLNRQEFFFENTYIDRDIDNDPDLTNPTIRKEAYRVYRSKVRAAHNIYKSRKSFLTDLDIYWYGQSVNLDTSQLALVSGNQNRFSLSKFESGVQLDQKINFGSVVGTTSASLNILDGFDQNFGLVQTFGSNVFSFAKAKGKAKINLGLKQRRPSFFQLFDPEFGNLNLTSEKLFYIRPETFIVLKSKNLKHNISLQYFFENIDSRVVFTQANTGLSKYENIGRLNSNSFIFSYNIDASQFQSHAFFRQSFDTEETLRQLPWLAKQELGLGSSAATRIVGQIFDVGINVKWLLGMYNPSGKQIGNLVQSQAQVSYHLDTTDRITLQLNNLFNDKKIWDEGFQRQPFSWMLSLTKTI